MRQHQVLPVSRKLLRLDLLRQQPDLLRVQLLRGGDLLLWDHLLPQHSRLLRHIMLR